MKAKIAEKIARYKYSFYKKEIAPSVIFTPISSSLSLISLAEEFISLPTFSYSDLFSLERMSAMTPSSILTLLTRRALMTPQQIPNTELPTMKAWDAVA
jgi:hypothetical protein